MDAAKKEREASDGKHPGCAGEFWEGRDSPPVQPFPCHVTRPLMDWPSLPSPQQLPFSLILWNPWATANNTQNTPSCFPLKQALS